MFSAGNALTYVKKPGLATLFFRVQAMVLSKHVESSGSSGTATWLWSGDVDAEGYVGIALAGAH